MINGNYTERIFEYNNKGRGRQIGRCDYRGEKLNNVIKMAHSNAMAAVKISKHKRVEVLVTKDDRRYNEGGRVIYKATIAA